MAVPVETALFIATAILLATLFGVIALVASRRQRAREDELRRAASSRGWKFEVAHEHGARVHRWSGSTDGISWTAESLRNASGNSKHERRRHIGRWHGSFGPGINGAIVVMGLPKGKEELGRTIADGESWIARLAQKAAGYAFDKAIDVYFGKGPGKEVDATTLHRVEAKLPGFVVMAADKDEGARVLQQGLESALRAATHDMTSALATAERPWILLRPHTVSLARMERFRDINDVDAFVRAGVALTRAFTFGRRA